MDRVRAVNRETDRLQVSVGETDEQDSRSGRERLRKVDPMGREKAVPGLSHRVTGYKSE